MVVYLFNLLNVTVLSLLAVRYSKIKYVNSLSIEKRIPNLLFVTIIIFCFMSVYALRWNVGTDFSNYYGLYFYYGNMGFTEILGSRDWGFYLISSIMYNLFPDNFIIYNYVLAALTYIPVVLILRKYSSNFVFSIILYITMMNFYSGFNGVRQSIAVSICFLAFPLLYKKKYIKYILIILVAYLFHSTALLMIPLIAIITRKSWSKPILITSAILIVSVFVLPNIWTSLINILDYIGQEKMANDYQNFKTTDSGINILRLLVAAVPLVFSLLFYTKLKIINPKIDILINMSLFYFIFLLFGTQMTVLARISTYFGIFNTLLIPEFANVFKGKDKIVFSFITIILFTIYMFMLLPVDSDLLPYRINIDK